MGTNYYLQNGICKCCHKPDSTRHIGKSSGGWCFSLHVYPDEGINNLDDWKKLFARHNTAILNEYDEEVSVEEMLKIITERSRTPRDEFPNPFFRCDTWEEFHRRNHSQDGPNNLLRHQIMPNHCIGHGEGTYDYIVGDFS